MTEQEKEETDVQPTQSHEGLEDGKEVPFGVRAIESGIEVEGVWISGSNTPMAISREASVSSIWTPDAKNERDSRSLELEAMSQKKVPALEQHYDVVTSSPTMPLLALQGRESSMCPEDSIDTQGKHVTLSSLSSPRTQYSTRQQEPRLCLLNDTADNHEISRPTSESTAMEETSTSFEDNCRATVDTCDDSLRSGTSCLIGAAPAEVSRDETSAYDRSSCHSFDLMYLHRQSQAAEIGQLTPRSRKTMSKGGYSHARNSAISSRDMSMTSILPLTEMKPALQRSSGRPKSVGYLEVTPTQTQDSGQFPLQDVASRSGLRRTKSEASSTVSDIELNKQEVDDQLPSQIDPPLQSSFIVRQSPVVRGHGTGFEILRPGTLKVSAPPVSLQNFNSRTRSMSSEGRRRLQKMRRLSASSDSSSVRSRNSSEGIV